MNPFKNCFIENQILVKEIKITNFVTLKIVLAKPFGPIWLFFKKWSTPKIDEGGWRIPHQNNENYLSNAFFLLFYQNQLPKKTVSTIPVRECLGDDKKNKEKRQECRRSVLGGGISFLFKQFCKKIFRKFFFWAGNCNFAVNPFVTRRVQKKFATLLKLVSNVLICRAGHLRYFLIFSIIRNGFIAFYIRSIIYFCTSPI